jgi:hypothetical protein
MSLRKPLLGLGLLTAGVAFAHHVPVPLSHIAGTEILTSITMFLEPTNEGVPAYLVAEDEHEHEVELAHGDSFFVYDQTGKIEQVVFDQADFQDITQADPHEIVAAINKQLTIAEAKSDNSYFVLRGIVGGSDNRIAVRDFTGAPLEKLHLPEVVVFGNEDVVLTLSIPEPDPGHGHPDDHLAGHPYFVMASSTDGSFVFKGEEVPIGRDATMLQFMRAMRSGVVEGFVGRLDDHQDAEATLPAGSIQKVLNGNVPDELYFAYVVFSMDMSSVEFVSNRFTIHVKQ